MSGLHGLLMYIFIWSSKMKQKNIFFFILPWNLDGPTYNMKQLQPSIVSSERTKTVKKPEQLGSIMATGHFDNILQLFFPALHV